MEPQAGINRTITADTTFLLGKRRGLYVYPTIYRTGKMVWPITTLAADYCRQAMLEFHRIQKIPTWILRAGSHSGIIGQIHSSHAGLLSLLWHPRLDQCDMCVRSTPVWVHRQLRTAASDRKSLFWQIYIECLRKSWRCTLSNKSKSSTYHILHVASQSTLTMCMLSQRNSLFLWTTCFRSVFTRYIGPGCHFTETRQVICTLGYVMTTMTCLARFPLDETMCAIWPLSCEPWCELLLEDLMPNSKDIRTVGA